MLEENRKQLYVDTIRKYLTKKRIKFKMVYAQSGSVYFRLDLDNHSNPVIRVSDHSVTKGSVTCNFNYAQVGKNARPKNIIARIEKGLDKTIKRSKAYSANKCWEMIQNG